MKQALTPAGVTAKTTELYALSNALLKDEFDAIRTDFDSWMDDHFTLNPTQKSYLSAMDVEYKKAIVVDIAYAVQFRLGITLDTSGTVSASKFIRKESTLEYVYHPTNGVTVTGDLTITFVYQ